MNQRTLHRWHIWLGWILAIPFLLWTASGLFMVARPIEEVRGTTVRAEPEQINLTALVLPKISGVADMARLVKVGPRDQWVVEQGKVLKRYDAHTGAVLPEVDMTEASKLADAAYLADARTVQHIAFDALHPPLDLRKERPSWQVHFDDGTHVYIDRESGEVLAIRTKQWRAFDFMWGLHIMDPGGREDTSHPLLIIAAVLSLVSVVIGTIMLFKRRKRKKIA